MTKIIVVKNIKENKYFLFINDITKGIKLESAWAEDFINKYPHVKPFIRDNAYEWTFTNP